MASEGNKRPGRPTTYSPEIATVICERMADGESLRRICLDEAMPGRTTVWQWLEAHQEFANQYARATEMRAEFYADEAMEIADTPCMGQKTVTRKAGVEITEGDMIEHRRLQIDVRKWTAAKLAPKRYGDPGRAAAASSDPEGNKPKLNDPDSDIP